MFADIAVVWELIRKCSRGSEFRSNGRNDKDVHVFGITKCSNFGCCLHLWQLTLNFLFSYAQANFNKMSSTKGILGISNKSKLNTTQSLCAPARGFVAPRYFSTRSIILYNQVIHFLHTDDSRFSTRWFICFEQAIFLHSTKGIVHHKNFQLVNICWVVLF